MNFKAIEVYAESLVKGLTPERRREILDGDLGTAPSLIDAQFGPGASNVIVPAIIEKILAIEEKQAGCTITWSCSGMSTSGVSAGSMRNAMHALNKNVGIPETHPIRKSGEKPSDLLFSKNTGMIIELLAVELRAQGVRVSVRIDPGHLFRHSCGRVYSVDEWNSLHVTPCEVPALINGKLIRMPTRRCGCGSHISYSSLELTHAEDVCNAPGGGSA